MMIELPPPHKFVPAKLPMWKGQCVVCYLTKNIACHDKLICAKMLGCKNGKHEKLCPLFKKVSTKRKKK
jgi:hypothetical protein